MSIRGIGDAYAFQRLLWLVIGTVIIPTAILAVYGVFAIRNQRAVFLQREAAERTEHLLGIAVELAHEMDRLDVEVRDRAKACLPEGPCELALPGVTAGWIWLRDPPAELGGIGLPTGVGSDTVWVTPPDQSAPVGVFRSGDSWVAWRVDMIQLQELAATVGGERHPQEGGFGLELARPEPLLSLDEMMRRFQQPTYAATLSLEPPLAQWRLTVLPSNQAAGILTLTSWLYFLGLVALVATVVTGTVLTLGATMREIRLSRLQTDFVSNISHELRTPLTSIRMFVETLQSGRLKEREKVKECLDLLAQESDRLSRRIERVLNWARMEAGRRVYEVETVPAREVVDDVLQAFKSHNLLDGLEEIVVQIPEDLPPLRVDRDAIVEALLNLVQNAVSYTEPPRCITVSAERRGKLVGMSVEDNGPGIHRQDRRRIFEKFYRAEALLSRRIQGSGLGLAIVRAVAQGHGGTVDLWTEVGRGSRFTIWLPAA
ncbi:MAG: HAMP domain-containing histidine kinase [Deltaproteobacteria bacterium]|nr:HAMP domain-containing histidine kinase [Deltaproteobacteria bacterium]MBW2253774.1 HAMP domain-containing histidine kinase [Deltaproteobacteria bacterium]